MASSYPEFDAFLALRDHLDPEGRFGNAHLDRILGRAAR
ncbi:D-arabinono-1,4-lactone oxidase [Actinomycetospora sp.]